MHRHDSICEMLLIYKGEGTYYVGDESYPLEEGSLIHYNQGDLHEVKSAGDKEIGSYCIGITNLRRKGLKRNHMVEPGGVYVRQSKGRYPVLKSMCQQMFELSEQGMLDVKAMTKEEKRGLLIREYLDQHFTEDVDLKQVVEALGCSVMYVSHTFKNSLGITPMQYVIQRRIGFAQTLLISTELSISQVASMVGYDNGNYFSTQFSKVVGMNPTKYRELYKEEARGRKNQS